MDKLIVLSLACVNKGCSKKSMGCLFCKNIFKPWKVYKLETIEDVKKAPVNHYKKVIIDTK